MRMNELRKTNKRPFNRISPRFLFALLPAFVHSPQELLPSNKPTACRPTHRSTASSRSILKPETLVATRIRPVTRLSLSPKNRRAASRSL
jgi:hypothetical protein